MTRRITEIRQITLRVERQIDVPAIHSDYVYTFFPRALRIDLRETGLTVAQARQELWNASCDPIIADMQPWLDAGWLPECDLGPELLQMRVYRGRPLHYSLLGIVVASLLTLGLALLWFGLWLLIGTPIVEAVEVRVPMSRPCRAAESDDVLDIWPEPTHPPTATGDRPDQRVDQSVCAAQHRQRLMDQPPSHWF